jgi:hypothetical protein
MSSSSSFVHVFWPPELAFQSPLQKLKEEYLAFLKKQGAPLDEKYLWE